MECMAMIVRVTRSGPLQLLCLWYVRWSFHSENPILESSWLEAGSELMRAGLEKV